jgi:ribonuclease HI
MAWIRSSFKGKQVWAEVDSSGSLAVSSGRVAIRYSASAGSKIYRAGASGVAPIAGASPEDLEAGVSADAKPKKRSRSSGFGSAGTRTAAQSAAAAADARQRLAALPEGTVVAFTDGGCRGNPGPAGSGAVVLLPDGRRGEASLSLGTATNNVGELAAIGLALDLLEEAGVPDTASVALFTDSKYTNGVLCLGWKAKANRDLILGLRERLSRRSGASIHWVAGHVGVDGNERADALANAGVAGITGSAWS